tara:strand:- start:232803 stop:233033 length:231 start_codon:yes stop_codon:yes gene_type:complete
MHAAIQLYHKLEEAELETFMSAIGSDSPDTIKPNPYKLPATKVWYWGINRWGIHFSYAEYDAREDAEKKRKQEQKQ